MLELLVRTGPGEVGGLGPHRLCVVVGQQSRVLVSAFSGPLEPAREARMEPRPLLRRQALVGDFAGERVLDRELALADDRRARSMTNEIPFLEHTQIRLEALEQLVDGAGPERAPDDGGRLQRRLLGRLQEVDAGCQNRPHRVGYHELVGELVGGPAAVLTLEHAPVDQRANELLDEEGIALRPLDDDLADGGGQLGRYELVEHAGGVRGESDSSHTVSLSRPRPPQVGLLRASSGRAVPRSSSGPRTSCSPASRRSRSASSPQCTSSISTTAG